MMKELTSYEFSMTAKRGVFRVEKPDTFHAVLINGAANQRHWNDFSFLYRTLVKVYGYLPKNITVLDGSFQNSDSDLDGDGVPDITMGSTIEDVKNVFANLKGRLAPDHQLLIAVNDHGGRKANESTFILQDGEMRMSEFLELYKELPSKRILSVHEQCYSGGFVRTSIDRGRVSMAAATDLELSWASMDRNFDEFIYRVTAAFAGQNHKGKRVNADFNRDGRVSAQEAFACASGADQRPESPLLESFANSGDASHIGLGF